MSLWINHKGKLCRVYKTTEMTDRELLILAEKSGTFDFLKNKEEDIYTANDGELIHIETN